MRYRIRLKGHLDTSWQEWLEGAAIVHTASGTTILSGSLPDQAALYRVLLKLRNLNLALLALAISESSQEEERL